MSIPAWEATLPQEVLVDGYSESMADNRLRTSMDVGPAKQRRRSAAGARPVTWSPKMTTAQLETFKTFYNSTLLNGTLRFSFTEPVDGATAIEMRFVDVPSWSAIEPGLYRVDMKLEILP